MSIAAFVLCAGLGTRLRPLTNKTPKPLINVTKEKKIIDFVMDWVAQYVTREECICLNLYYLPRQLIDYFSDKSYIFSLEEELLGTAGALKKMEMCVVDNFIVINGDTITNVSLNDLMLRHLETKALTTIFSRDDAIRTGGVYIFNKRVLKFIPKDTFYSIKDDLMPDLIERKEKIELINPFGTFYIDCGTPEGLTKTKKILKN